MPHEGRSLKEAGGGDARPSHAEAPLPLERSILWAPADGSTGSPDPARDVRTYPLFLEHDVLAGVNRHLVKEEREARFGFLLGRLFFCPELGVNYAVADTAVAAREVLTEEASGADLIRAWSDAQSVFAGHTGLLLGWYHSHHDRLGLRLTEADRDTNARYFDAPWQCAIVVASEREPVIGAVFRHRGAGTGGGGERPAPFHELLTAPHGGEIGEADSAMAWTNYRAHRPDPAREYQEQVAEEAGRDPLPDPPPESPSESSSESQPESPSDSQDARDSQDERDSQGAADSAPESPAPARPAPRFAIVDLEEEPTGRRDERAQDHRGVRPEEHPGRNPQLVIPGEGSETGLFAPRGRRLQISWPWPVSPRVILAVAALVAALVFLLPILRDGETSGPETSGTPTPRAREATSPALRAFIELVDAVQIAGDRYAERAADFDAGRIGCDLLTTGYVAADEAYVRVAAGYREFGSDPNPRAVSAYERAGSEMADVNRHFDSAGCPRP